MASTRTTPGTIAALSLVVAALAGCSDDPGPTPSPTPTASSPAPSPGPSDSSTSSASSSATPTGTSSVPAGFSLDVVSSPTFPDLGGNIGAVGAVRVGRHSGFDRVVWEFAGSGRPTFQVHYVDQPTGEGSGDVVDVRGDAWLEVRITTVGVPGASTPRPSDASAASLAGTVVAEAKAVYGGFEGYGQTFVGVRDRQRPFKVTVLTSPTRLVVDISTG